MERDLLRIENLTMAFGGIRAIDNLTMSISGTEIVAIIGPNGSGKTTLFNVIVHLYTPGSGRIYFGDPPDDLVRLPTHEIVARGVARTFQTIRLFPNLTVVENVLVGMHIRRASGSI